ncbi:O-antigen ligase family protein [Neobacillus drentensis]|uniref:O-antigen ligase family protein n=1 Tax=Neobacillus drentensis TaxID=220684 RepID=UPI00285EAFCD|nr:O-antigen ligase family protein [Neobacillus drentensis]MDR7237417.1 putative inorganic carbon (HCO3(-)) transporter [Neobacillus drentensis]
MYWFIILFPLLIYPWGIDPYYTTTKMWYLDLFVLGTWIYLIIKRRHRAIIPEKNNSAIEIFLIIFLLLIEVSTAFSKYTYTSVHGTIDRGEGLITFFSYISVFLFSYRLIDMKKLNNVISGMVIVSIFISIYGILQHYSFDFLPRNSAMRGYPGTYTFFDNPNFFGSYLVLVLLLTITLYLTVNNNKLSSLYFITVCLNFIALIFSNTRSGYVGVFCGVVFLSIFVVYKRKYLWKKWSLLLLTLGLLLLTIDITEKGHYFNRISSVVSESYSIVSNQTTGYEGSSRYFIWKESLPLVKEYFWTGSGPDTFEFIFPATPDELQYYLGNPNIKVDKAHNEYLQIAITLGTPALLAYLLFLFAVFRKLHQAVKMVTGKEKIILFGLTSTIIGYLVQAFFNISTVPVAPLFWSILGISLAKSNLHLKNAKTQNSHMEITDKYKSA